MRYFKFITHVILILSMGAFISCGFNFKKKIASNYYLIEVDTPDDFDICYKLYNGDYIGLLGGGLKGLRVFNNTMVAEKAMLKKAGKVDIQYYIIPMYPKGTLDPTAGIVGPITQYSLGKRLGKVGLNLSQFSKIILR